MATSAESEKEVIASLKAELEDLKREQLKWTGMVLGNGMETKLQDVGAKRKAVPGKHLTDQQKEISPGFENPTYCSSNLSSMKEQNEDSPTEITADLKHLLDEEIRKSEEHKSKDIPLGDLVNTNESDRNQGAKSRHTDEKTVLPLPSNFGNDKVQMDNYIADLLSFKSTDSDNETNSVKISTEISELHTRLADLLSKNEELERAKDYLERKCRKLEGERHEIIKINHIWEEQHQLLLKKHEAEMKERDSELDTLKRQLSDDQKTLKASLHEEKEAEIADLQRILSQEQEEISRLTKEADEGRSARQRLTHVTNTLEHMEMMLEEEKKEKELVSQREKLSQQQIKSLEATMALLQNQIDFDLARRKVLEEEVKRLAHVVRDEDRSPTTTWEPRHSETDDTPGGRHRMAAEQREQIELLKHQISTYSEDFKCEREEKEKVMQQNEKLKMELRTHREQLKTLFRQLKIYESNFRREREERIRLMRLTGQLPPEPPHWGLAPVAPTLQYKPYFSERRDPYGSHELHNPTVVPGTAGADNEVIEYCRLAEEREKIRHRMNELELQGVTHRAVPASSLRPRPRASPLSRRRASKEGRRDDDIVADAEAFPRSGSFESGEPPIPLSPKLPSTCPKCGLSPESKKEILFHYERCTPE